MKEIGYIALVIGYLLIFVMIAIFQIYGTAWLDKYFASPLHQCTNCNCEKTAVKQISPHCNSHR